MFIYPTALIDHVIKHCFSTYRVVHVHVSLNPDMMKAILDQSSLDRDKSTFHSSRLHSNIIVK